MKSTKLAYIYEFPKFLSEIRKLNDIIFFFPYYHFGGGETVHLDILKTFKDYKTSCFIVHQSHNNFLKDQYIKASQIIDLGKYKSTKYKSYFKSLAKAINSKDNPIVFGCNNHFFYKLVEYLDESNVKIIDLTHAFSYEQLYSLEKVSIPMVHKIHKRIVLGKKTYNDYKNLYIENNVNLSFLERIVVINNAIEIPNHNIIKPINTDLKVLFVSRNSFEKRPEVFFEIARRCHNHKIKASFTVIGDFENVKIDLPNLKFVGSIKEKQKINEYYLENDILLVTSFREGFPMVILESMAYGVVPISTNVGEISSLINQENRNGIILNDQSVERYTNTPHDFKKNKKWYPENKIESIPKDLECIIKKFIQEIEILENDRELLNELSINAIATVKQNYCMEKYKKSYHELFFGNNSNETQAM